MDSALIQRAERLTVQELPDAKKDNGASAVGFWMDSYARGELLPSRYTRERQRWLREYDNSDYNTLWRGARANIVNKFASTEFELSGGRNLTKRFDDVLRYAQFGKGAQHLRQLLARDYLVYDHGAFMEIIAPGNPSRPPTGAVTGIAHLDAYACLPTGDPEFPVLYTDTKGKQHLLHHTRVVQFVDSPSGDQTNPGYGESALSRAAAIIYRQILIGRYIVTQLDDKPPPGVLLVCGITDSHWKAAWQRYIQEQSMDSRPEWGRVIPLFGADAAIAPDIKSVSFSTPPEKFDYKVYVELDVHELALAIGVDIQELWELTTNNLGSSGQSEIQHVKSKGKTLGMMLSSFERAMNNYVLPDSLEFKFKVQDPYEAQNAAQNAQIWTGVATQLAPLIGNQLAAEILTNQVEAIADALLDEDGEMVRLPDADVKPADQQQTTDATVTDDTPQAAEGGQQQTTTQDDTPPATKAKDTASDLAREFDITRKEFIEQFKDILDRLARDEITLRRAEMLIREQISEKGRRAYSNGLAVGGVLVGLGVYDRAQYAVWLARQNQFLKAFIAEIEQSSITPDFIEHHGQMWANKSLQSAYYAGLQSADANGMYQFVGDDGDDSCATCKRLKGVKMRMSDWADQKLRPRVDTENYECGGWRCQHSLQRVS